MRVNLEKELMVQQIQVVVEERVILLEFPHQQVVVKVVLVL